MLSSHPLYGKRIAVLGDSISTVANCNTPFWHILPIDVGHEIHSYVTWFDIYKDLDRSIGITGKTIGGVLLDESMVGRYMSFIPLSEDVGKTVGDVRNYNAPETYVWHQRMCDYSGAALLANASWSGSTIVDARDARGIPFTNTHAWSDYTIGRCHIRDEEGKYIDPDVIIIERGTNDFTFFNYNPYPKLSINDVRIDNGINWEDDKVDGVANYLAGYYLTIKKLRAAYPMAQIVCCTVNCVRRSNATEFPTRNPAFTLPELNDAIRKVATTMGCDVINFDRTGITVENCYPTYIDDSLEMATHPNNNGHELMARRALADIRYVI